MPARRARAALWVIEAAAVAGCVLLAGRRLATVQHGWPAMMAWVVAVAVLLALVVTASSRPAPAGIGLALLALYAPGLRLADSPRTGVWAFALGALLPLAVLLALGGRPRWALATVAVAAAAALAGRVLLRDPFRERRCLPACVTNPDLITRAPGTLRVCELALAWSAIATVPFVLRRSETGRHGRVDAIAGVALGALLVTWSVRLLQRPRALPGEPADRAVFAVETALVVVTAAAHAWPAGQLLVTRRRVSAFTASLADAGDMTTVLAGVRRAVGDDVALDVGTPAAPQPGMTTTAVVRGGRTVATLVHRPDSRSRVVAAVTPAVAIALETELVRREAEAQLAELERSRAQATRRVDDARRRLERNLHDGAQQRLLVTGMQLGNALAGETVSESRRAAAELVGEALHELRRIGRGDAAIVAELGLADAARSLAASTQLPIEVHCDRCATPGHECWPVDVSTVAYRLLVGAIGDGERGAATAVHAMFACLTAGGRSIRISHDGLARPPRPEVVDRVHAAGGRLGSDGPTNVFEVWLPSGS